MTRIDQVLLGGVGVGLVLAALNGLRGPDAVSAAAPKTPAPAAAASHGDASPQSTMKADVDAFLAGLESLRRNGDAVLPSLRELSQRLCSVHHRCEAKDLVTYYASLTVEQRKLGWANEARFNELRHEIVEARRKNLPLEQWRELRVRVIEGLRQLVPTDASQGDCVPAARALSLCARLEVEWIEKDAELSAERREKLLTSAEEDAHASTVLFTRAGMLVPQLEPKWLLGRLEAARGSSDSAQSTFEDCLALARRVDNESYAERALVSMIALAQQAGDVAEVERLVNQIAAFRSPTESWPLARAQAELLFERDEPALAVEFLERHQPEDANALRDWHLLLAAALLRTGRSEEAREHYESGSSGPRDFDMSWSAANLQLRAGNPADVVQKFGDAQFLAGIRPCFRMNAEALLGEAYMRLRQFDSAADHLARALELGAQAQTRLESQRAQDDGAVGVLGEAVGMQTLALLAEARARTGKHLEAARVIEAYQTHALRRELSAGDEPGERINPVPNMRECDVLEWARSYEFGLVTWVVGADSSVVAYVGPDGSAIAVPIARARKTIEEAVRRVREATVAGDDALLSRLVREIRSELLPAEIVAQLEKENRPARGRLLFLLHGPLERMPIELLALDGAPFAGRCIPVVLPGLPESSPGVAASTEQLTAWTMLGSPVDDAGTAVLPGALEEINEISRLHAGAKSYVGAAFDRAALRQALSSTNAVHIATHLRPGCGASKGRLADVGLEVSRADSFCAREVLEAKPNLALAVLDACETAGGGFVDGEGLQGISRAFLESGTRNLIVTLWPVEDRVARAFAVALHRALIDGARPSEAAARARDALRAAGMDPVDWAAFRALARD